jgi:hypothetical protein
VNTASLMARTVSLTGQDHVADESRCSMMPPFRPVMPTLR